MQLERASNCNWRQPNHYGLSWCFGNSVLHSISIQKCFVLLRHFLNEFTIRNPPNGHVLAVHILNESMGWRAQTEMTNLTYGRVSRRFVSIENCLVISIPLLIRTLLLIVRRTHILMHSQTHVGIRFFSSVRCCRRRRRRISANIDSLNHLKWNSFLYFLLASDNWSRLFLLYRNLLRLGHTLYKFWCVCVCVSFR